MQSSSAGEPPAPVDCREAGDSLRMLLSSGDPRVVVQQFQKQHELSLAPCGEVVEFFDLLGFKRHELHFSVFLFLRNYLNKIIPTLDEERSKKLLSGVLLYSRFPEFLPVIITILRHLREMPSGSLISSLSEDAALFQNLPRDVQERIWKADPSVFVRDIAPSIRNYMEDGRKESPNTLEKGLSPRERRLACKSLERLWNFIGSSPPLYAAALGVMRNQFISTGDSTLCSLRFHLLMVLVDRDLLDVFGRDPCLRIVRILDGSFDTGTVSDSQLPSLQTYLADLKRAKEPDAFVAEIGWAVGDPRAVSVLSATILRRSVAKILTYGLPREDLAISALCQILSLVTRSRSMFSSGSFPTPEDDPHVLSHFLPLIVANATERLLRWRRTKTADMDVEMESSCGVKCNPDVVKAMKTHLQQSLVAQLLAMESAIECASSGDIVGTAEILQSFGSGFSDGEFDEKLRPYVSSFRERIATALRSGFKKDDLRQLHDMLDSASVPFIERIGELFE